MRGPRGGAILCREEYAKAIDKAVFPGMQGGPLMHVIAAKAVCFHEAAQPEFRAYAEGIVRNAKALAAALAGEGFRIVSGGTDNHLMLVDLRPFGVTGKVAQEALDRAGITLNKNTIPNDPESPVRHQRAADRHGGGDHRRHGRGRDGRDRLADRPGPAGHRRRAESPPRSAKPPIGSAASSCPTLAE